MADREPKVVTAEAWVKLGESPGAGRTPCVWSVGTESKTDVVVFTLEPTNGRTEDYPATVRITRMEALKLAGVLCEMVRISFADQ